MFWAVRGGGGNFGVVTSFEYRLYPVGPTVMMLVVMYPAEAAPAVFPAWRDFMVTAPDEFSSQAFFWSIPAVEGFPRELWNKPLIILAGMYAGAADEGERVLEPLRHLATPVLDLSGQMPCRTAQTLFDPFFPAGQRCYYFKSTDLARLDDQAIDAVIACAHDRPVPSILLAIWHYGGAMRRSGSGESAFGGRDTPFLFSVDSVWDDPADSAPSLPGRGRKWPPCSPFRPAGSTLIFPVLAKKAKRSYVLPMAPTMHDWQRSSSSMILRTSSI